MDLTRENVATVTLGVGIVVVFVGLATWDRLDHARLEQLTEKAETNRRIAELKTELNECRRDHSKIRDRIDLWFQLAKERREWDERRGK